MQAENIDKSSGGVVYCNKQNGLLFCESLTENERVYLRKKPAAVFSGREKEEAFG